MITYGRGLVNSIINKLPVELHLPGYQYCGPGTKLQKRLARGDPGINPLDVACKAHDIAYSQNRDNLAARHAADKELAEQAIKRVFAKDSSVGEKAAALGVSTIMHVKNKLGMGMSKTKSSMKKKVALRKIIDSSKSAMKRSGTVKSALIGARDAVHKAGGRKNIILPRVLPVPIKTGGFLPAFLLPLFAGLSATGALAGGAAGIAKAVNDVKAASQKLEESKRHNRKMESIAMGKGLHLIPYRHGMGLHLSSKRTMGKGLYLRPYRTQGMGHQSLTKKKHTKNL